MKRAIVATSVVGVLIALGVFFSPFSGSGQSSQELVFYSVSRADLPIVVTERGYMESQEQTSLRCMVDTYDRRSGVSGTTILSIVPNGSLVQEGDILVELDSASIRDLLETELLELESDRSSLRQAEARKQNQITQNETSLAEAKLALKLAELNREMYVDPEAGSFRLSVSEIERQVDEARNAILEAQAALKLQETEKDGIEQLFQLGYKGKSDLEQSRFAFLKSEAALASAVNQLANIEATKRQLESYTRQMELMKLDGEVETAKRSLKQVTVTNESELAQVEAQLFESQERVQRQESRIAHYRQQLEFCTMRAPHAGMVVYAQNSQGTTSIAVGQEVRTRQTLLTLPDLSRMQVRLQIHEAVLDQVHPGQQVSLRVDAFPNNPYRGVVEHVGVVPTANSKSVKTYECIVRIPDTVKKLKPGMTAVSEIHIDRLRDIISLPVQSVVQIDNETWCYVENGSSVRKQTIELGRNNDKFVEVVDGVGETDRVVLNPMAIARLENRNRDNQIAPDAGATPPPIADEVQGDEGSLVKTKATEQEPQQNAT